ncbi:MAG: MarR family winged helix-turn-helix transcriptional regulator [Atopobiaceae bacterium]
MIHHWMHFTSQYRILRQRIESRIKLRNNLCLNDFYLLYYLGESKDHKMKLQDACELIHMSQSALSRLVQRLESYKKPIITRSVCEADKRAVYIGLTDDGRDLYESIIKDIADILIEFSKIDFSK